MCVPIYFAFVVGSHTVGDVLAGAAAVVARGPSSSRTHGPPWTKGNLGRLLFNSLVVAPSASRWARSPVSLLSAFAITYFRFRFRMLAFWLIFASLMLPVEVRILPTYEAVANVALPLQWALDALDVGRWIGALTGRAVEISLEWNMMNSYSGLILPLIASATATFLFRQFFLTVPEELLRGAPASTAPRRCASSGTCCCRSRSRTWWRCPSSSFLYGWNQYLWPLLFTTDKDMATAVIGLKHLIRSRTRSRPGTSAMNAALLVMLPPAWSSWRCSAGL